MKITTFIKSALILLLIASSFAACKKDDSTPKIPIEGKWTAKFTPTKNNNPSFSLYFTFINEGGILEVRENSSDAMPLNSTDKWFITNNTAFTATFLDDSTFNLMGTYNPTTGKITSGTFGFDETDGDKYTNIGTWTMTKDAVQ